LKDVKEPMDHVVKMEDLAKMVSMENQEKMVPLVNKENQENQDNPDSAECGGDLDYQGVQDHKEKLVNQETPVLMVLMEPRERKDLLVSKDVLVNAVLPEMLASLA